MSLTRRVDQLEQDIAPQALCHVTEWYADCEPQQAAIDRVGAVGPDDVILVIAAWSTCDRPEPHRHDEVPIIRHPRR
jgi:hypothetical protein